MKEPHFGATRTGNLILIINEEFVVRLTFSLSFLIEESWFLRSKTETFKFLFQNKRKDPKLSGFLLTTMEINMPSKLLTIRRKMANGV